MKLNLYMQVHLATTDSELQKIISLRYKILREPWQQALETAFDNLEAASYNAFIVNENDEVIACGRLQKNNPKTGQIRYMAVDAKYQGKSLGKRIVKFLEEKALELKLNEIELQARENAVKFYESQGYVIKEKTFLLWGIIQHYLMVKKLN